MTTALAAPPEEVRAVLSSIICPMEYRRILLRIAIAVTGIIIAIPCGIAAWLYFYTGALPDVLRAFAPSQQQIAYLQGEPRPITVLPASLMGSNAWNAVLAAEGDPDPRGWLRRYYAYFAMDITDHRYGSYSWQIARMLPHDKSRGVHWQLWWLRTSIQIERHFTPDEMLTIYANSAYFGDDIKGSHVHGIHDAALHYFGKAPANLTPAQAALLAGLISRPSFLSPTKHPDRTLAARNRVIDRMLAKGFLTAAEASRAKEEPL